MYKLNILKVKKSQKQFMVLSILPKNERKKIILSTTGPQDNHFR